MRYYSDDELEAILDDDDDEDETLEVMSEEDDEDIYSEDDEDEFYALEDDDDDESEMLNDDDDDEAERRYFRRRRFRRRRGRRFRRAPRRRFVFNGKKTARLTTRAGRSATVRFSKSFATTAQVKKAIDTLAKDVRKNGTGIVRVDKQIKRVDASTKKAMVKQNNRLSKFEKSVKKQIADAKQDAQQAALLPLLLNQSGDEDGLDPIVLLAVTGGLGGAGKSGGLDPVMLLALSGGLS